MTITQIVEPIEGEQGCFRVQSRSRPEMKHRVDLQYRETPKSKPKPICQCEAYLANKHTAGIPCWHIEQAVAFEKKRLGL